MAKCSRDNEECAKNLRCFIKVLVVLFLATISAGPLLCLTIQQVCVSKCLLMRRLPIIGGANADDILLIILFGFYVGFNYCMCCLFWSLFRKSCKVVYCKYATSDTCKKVTTSFAKWALMIPKKTRNAKVYSCRKTKTKFADACDDDDATESECE